MNSTKSKSNIWRYLLVIGTVIIVCYVLLLITITLSNIFKPIISQNFITNYNFTMLRHNHDNIDNINNTECILPPAFPKGIPSLDKLNLCINKRLPSLDIACNHSVLKCSQCVPPWGGPDWAIHMTKIIQEQELESRDDRRKELYNIIKNNLTLISPSQPIIIMVFNYGFSYLFLNYLCSLHKYDLLEKIRQSSIIVVTDNQAAELCQNYGFMTVKTSSWLKNKISITNKAELFSDGDYKYFIAFKILYTNDLLHLGYNVIQQDIDIIYKKDVIQYFIDLNKLKYSYDIAMSNDGRIDNIGPGNAGFIYIRSNCKTLIFVNTLLHYIGLVLQTRDDQMFWNEFLKDSLFRQIIFHLLSPNKFVSGYQWGHSKNRDTVPNNYWMLHASWVDAHYKKITKFKILGEWYLDATCPYYQPGIVPDHKEPEYYILNGTWKWPDPNEPEWWNEKD